jgi:transposase-like protein
MIIQVLHCPYCQGSDIVRHGLSPEGKQRYRCRACLQGRGRTFLLDYSYAGQSPAVKQQIVDMAMNASGIRDTAESMEKLGIHAASGISLPAMAGVTRMAGLLWV